MKGHEKAMIGHYLLGKKIGNGGFGVVRCTYCLN